MFSLQSVIFASLFLNTDEDVFMPVKCVVMCTGVFLWKWSSVCVFKIHTKAAACCVDKMAIFRPECFEMQ